MYNIEGNKEFDIREDINLKDKKIDKHLKTALLKMDQALESGTYPKKIQTNFPKERLSFINSIPEGKLYVDKRYFGVTPLISYLPQKNIKIKIVPNNKEYNPLTVKITKEELPVFLLEGKSLMLEKDYLSRAKKLISKNKKEAISLLEQIPSSYSYFPKSVVMLSGLLMDNKEYKKVIEKTSFILNDRNFLQSDEKNKDKMNLYLLNNISSIKYAQTLKDKQIEERTEYYKDALIDGSGIFSKLGGTSQLDQSLSLGDSDLFIDFWYYQGLASLKLWQQTHDTQYKDKLVDIWQNYLNSKKIDDYSSLNKEQKSHVRDARKLYDYIK